MRMSLLLAASAAALLAACSPEPARRMRSRMFSSIVSPAISSCVSPRCTASRNTSPCSGGNCSIAAGRRDEAVAVLDADDGVGRGAGA